MMWIRTILVLVAFATVAVPVPAQGLFSSRKPPANPDQHVQQLVITAQTASESSKRVNAVAELRDYSTTTYPQIVPTLVHILRNDKSVAVRIEAAHCLGRIRPLTKMAGDALAEAVQKDSALRVRWQARTSLTLFNVAGLNPNNHEPGENVPLTANGSSKDVPVTNSGGPILVPQPGATVIVPGGATPAGPSEYSLPLPKGPSHPVEIEPLPNPGFPVPVETVPPLAPVGPGPGLTPEPPLAAPTANEPPPIVIPDVGPILAPPPG
jgi:hypothetical protein